MWFFERFFGVKQFLYVFFLKENNFEEAVFGGGCPVLAI